MLEALIPAYEGLRLRLNRLRGRVDDDQLPRAGSTVTACEPVKLTFPDV